MEKFIPYEKLSKKKKRALDAARRGTWGALDPRTRRRSEAKVYKRKRTRVTEESDEASFSFLLQNKVLYIGQ